ncbi:MAG: protein kinase domain-containing protein, partial [Gemmatimonadaceae bacterium]
MAVLPPNFGGSTPHFGNPPARRRRIARPLSVLSTVMMDLRDQLQTTLGSAYTLERELGGGGMSRVFVAEETSLERKVVVKVLPPELTAGVNVDRFKREILLAAKLQHPHIVPVLTSGETNGLPYYTMPLVEGESLRVKLAHSGALPITEAISILRDVARALAYAHERGIVHRDIKPENVLLSGGSATVTDFGIAKALSASRTRAPNATLTQIGTSLGTPAYMAPEQAAADPATDHRADLYAFGCMAYELLAGRPPFVGKTPQRLLAAQMGETPQPIFELRPDAPVELASMTMRCLAKDADDRPQSAADIVRVLDTVTSGGGHVAMPPILRGGRHAIWKALAIYVVAFVIVALVAKSAIIVIGLPDWVYPGALAVMMLGLPAILFTAYVQRATRRLITMTPTYTPGGSSAPQGTMATMAMKASPHMSWRRTAAGGASALAAFVLLIGAFMLMRAAGVGPFGSLLASGQLDAKQPLLVAEFSAKGGADSALGGVVAEAVRADLAQSNAVHVMPVSMIHDALQRMQRPLDTRINADVARQIAQRDGSKAVITGDITPLGGGFVVTARIVAAESGNELASFQGTANSPSELIPTVGKLSRDLRGKIGESLKAVQNSPALEAVTTASLDALRKYAEGARAGDAGDYPRSIDALKQAVAIDPTFAMAWRKLAVDYVNAGMSPILIDSALTRAYQNREHLTDKEKYATIGTYYQIGPGNDRAKAIQAYRQAMALGDYSASANNLGNVLVTRREFAAAESAYTARILHDPAISVVTFQGLGSVLVDEGKFASADSMARAYGKVHGPTAEMAEVHVASLYARGAVDSAQALAEQWKTVADPVQRGTFLNVLAAFDERRGQLDNFMRIRAQGAAEARARGAFAPALADSMPVAFFDAWFRGQPDRAVRTLDAALAATPLRTLPVAVRPYAGVAQIYAMAGQPGRARAILAQMDAEVKDSALIKSSAPDRHTALAMIALDEKRPLDAVREFRLADALPDGPANDCVKCTAVMLGMAFDRANLPDSAIAQFQRYLDTPYSVSFGTDGDYLAFVYKS